MCEKSHGPASAQTTLHQFIGRKQEFRCSDDLWTNQLKDNHFPSVAPAFISPPGRLPIPISRTFPSFDVTNE
jgi:hypothetical protein